MKCKIIFANEEVYQNTKMHNSRYIDLLKNATEQVRNISNDNDHQVYVTLQWKKSSRPYLSTIEKITQQSNVQRDSCDDEEEVEEEEEKKVVILDDQGEEDNGERLRDVTQTAAPLSENTPPPPITRKSKPTKSLSINKPPISDPMTNLSVAAATIAGIKRVRKTQDFIGKSPPKMISIEIIRELQHGILLTDLIVSNPPLVDIIRLQHQFLSEVE